MEQRMEKARRGAEKQNAGAQSLGPALRVSVRHQT